jgi:hypothetical protein
MAAAEKRKLEQAIAQDKVERKKLQKESEFDEKPKFVTKGYIYIL